MQPSNKAASRAMVVVGFALVVTVQAAFEFVALLYKPTILWIFVPALTIAIYISAVIARKAFRVEQVVASFAVAICLTYDLFRGYLESISGANRIALTEALATALLFCAVSNCLMSVGVWLAARVRTANS